MDAGTTLSIAMIGIFASIGGGLWMIIKGGNRKRGILMLVMAAVLAANVAILMLPVKP
jgi:hypothetical protein